MLQHKPNTENAQKLLIIDADVLDAEILLKDRKPGYQVIRLDPASEPVTQLTDAIHQHAPVQEIVLVAHAIPGQIHFSGGLIGSTQLERHQQQLQAWRKSLSHDAKLCVYACELAAGEEGTNFINLLSDLTGAEVAASSLPVGKTETSWNWDLDCLTKFFEVPIPFSRNSVETYRYTLAPEISIAGTSAIEDGFLEFVVTLSEASLGEVRIPYRTLEDAGTALGNFNDFDEVTNTLVIPAGQTSGTIFINTRADNFDEADESVILELFDPENAVFPNGAGNLRATGVILDNDGSGNDRALFVSQVKMVEGDNGSQQAVFDVQLSEPSSNAITLNYTTSDGSALAGQDYQAQTGSVTFNPGETLKSVAVPIIGDTIAEANEFFNLVVTPTVAIANGVDGAVGTAIIQDDDTSTTMPEISIAGTSAIEDGFLEFVVTLSEASLGEVRIPYRTLEDAGTALGNFNDFDEVTNTLVIPAGQTSGTIFINTRADNFDEADESVVLELFEPVNGVFPDGVETLQATGIILDNDGTGNNLGLFVGNAQIVEGENNFTREVAVPIHLSRPSDQTLTFQYQTADDTAIAGSDYTAQSGTVTFLPGETLTAVHIPVIGDDITENSETFTLTVTPTAAIANGSDGGTGTVTIIDGNESGPNNPPVAQDDAFATDEDTSVSGNVLVDNGNGADSDPDGDTLSVSSTGVIATALGASVTVNADGTFDYDPNGQFESLDDTESTTDSFAYTLSDGNGGTDTATVSITINGVNDAPVAQPDSVSTDEDTILNGNVLNDNGNGADSDVEGDVLSVTAENITTAAGALVTLNADGTFSYDPNGQFEALNDGKSAVDSFTYTLSDGDLTDTETVTVTVNGITDVPVNNPPVAQDDTFATDEDTNVAGNLLADNGSGADSDPDGDTLSVSSTGVIATALSASVTVNADGTFDYDPNGQFESLDDTESTTDSFAYTLSDGNGGTDTATVSITINGVNDAPVAQADSVSTDEDTVLNGNVLNDNGNGADSDIEGDALSVTAENITTAAGALVALNADGTFSYDPNGQFEALNNGEFATDSFTYTLSDGDLTDTETVTVTVNGVPAENNPPVAQDDAFATDEDSNVAGNLLADNGSGADSDPDGDTLSVSSAGVIATALGASVTVNADGTFDYDPNGQFETLDDTESATDTFDYTLSDGNGGTDAATVSITVNGVNDAPVAQADSVSTDEDTVLNGNVLNDNGNGADSDIEGDALSVTAENITTAAGALVVLNADGTFSYDPNGLFEALNDGESAIDSFAYTLSDGDLTDMATVEVEVKGVDDIEPPVVVTIGDAPLRVSRSNPDVWKDAWTVEAVSISHKADLEDIAEIWSGVTLNGRNAGVLNGGDLFGGDLGVSGQSLVSSTIRQEIDGTEALRFDLDQAAIRVTIDLSRLDGSTANGHFDAGRLQLLDSAGAVVDELVFSADAASHEKQIALDYSAGFSSVVLTAGSYNGADFVFGGLSDAAGQYLSGPQDLGNGTWNASDYLVDAVEFEFGEITLVGAIV
ncbi:VCBS repeat-containing protein [Nitrosomonas sp. Nm51]|uniref:Ig-like domain-containing protein n=1 Tax=Nitrosomonas sp. Nm51 TaxID=133720 RepID=UPI0008C25C15|nr:Ig-like domain-containing protein [Nitrosomonas sp. Nm51]SER06556.1 VCBS repeat-containing protein [Nitrosomonas sp. Nm51]